MTTEFDVPEDISAGEGGNWLKAPGVYHMEVLAVDEEPTKKSGELITGDPWKISCSVLAGPEETKTFDIMLFAPKANGKDGGEWATKKRSRMLYATGLIDESTRGKKITIDLQKMKKRQFIVGLQLGDTDDNGNQRLEVAFANIWHIDEPAAAAQKAVRNDKAIALIPKAHRRDPASFPTKSTAEGAGGHGGGNGGNRGQSDKKAAGATAGTNGSGSTDSTPAGQKVSPDLGDI